MKLTQMSNDKLKELHSELKDQYEGYKAKKLELNMARGKPAPVQLDLSADLLTAVTAGDYKTADGTDTRNYGIVDGIPEAKALFADILGISADNVIIGGSASLNLMFDTIARAMIKGVLPGMTPWSKLDKIKFLCPAPGYDRHFTICENFDIEMITIEMDENGPDMDKIEELVANDNSIKGIWCVPKYSNPAGITYSDEVVRRLANLKPAAEDFRVFFDNAYCLHDLDRNDKDELLNLYDAFVEADNEDMMYMYASTSKVTFAGAGISAIAASPANIAYTKKQMSVQTIGYDKINQLRHCHFFGDIEGIYSLMDKHGEILRPKFQAVFDGLNKYLADYDCATWTEPKGGYFISLNTMEGCAKKVVSLCKDSGVVLTGAGATYPYGNDPKDSNIRIAPSFPTVDELVLAVELFCVCVKLASVEKLLA